MKVSTPTLKNVATYLEEQAAELSVSLDRSQGRGAPHSSIAHDRLRRIKEAAATIRQEIAFEQVKS